MILPPTDNPKRQAAVQSFFLATTCLIESLLLTSPPSTCWASTGFDPNTHRLKPCVRGSNCVSSNYAEAPNSYVAPFSINGDRTTAFQRVIDDVSSAAETNGREGGAAEMLTSRLANVRVAEVLPSEFYIHLTTPGTAPGSLDDLELVFPEDGGIANVRCDARVVLPPPPFCVRKNCINANMDQRRRVEELGLGLGLPPVNQRQMNEEASWTPIFFNSDRVPET